MAITIQTIEDLSAGNYSVTVTDNNGCSVQSSVSIPSINPPILDIASTVPASCGQNNGSIELGVSGGQLPYAFLWSNNEITEDLADLLEDDYTVTVTGANGCTATASATVGQTGAAPIPVLSSTTPAACGQATGSINLTVTGGATPYIFMWSNNITTEDLFNLTANTYTVTVTGANGCTATASAIIGQTGAVPIPVITSTTPAACGQMNGSINLSVTGGASPYVFLWNNGTTTEDLSNLAANMYTVTVTGANGCSATETVNVGQTGAAPIPTITSNTPAACGQATGSINLSVSGGSAPYTFLWSNIATTEDLSNLSTNTYTVTVTGANGCSATTTVTVGQTGNTLSTILQASNVTSCASPNGSILVNITGGTPPFTFDWSDLITGNEPQNRTDLNEGTYDVTVTDANQCTAATSAALNFTGILPVKVFQAGICDGQSYVFNNKTYDQPGIYTDTLNISSGCDTVLQLILTLKQLNLQISAASNLLCLGKTMNIAATASNCNDCTYLWNNGSTASAISVTTGGNYFVTAADFVGCTATTFLQLNTAPAPVASISSPDGSTLSCDMPSVIVFGSGGTSYQWSGGIGTSPTITIVQEGAYELTVTNAEGCTDTISVNINADYPPLDIARNDSTELEPESTIIVDILGNDFIPSGKEFILNVIQGPAHCAVTITADNRIKLTTLDNGYSGDDQIIYSLCDPDCLASCDSAILRIHILKGCMAIAATYIPKGFSPNGDNRNDIFDPIAVFFNVNCEVLLEKASLSVYARNGECIFSAFPYKSWTGLENDRTLPEGAYFYILTIRTIGYSTTFRGTINLISTR